MRRALCNGRPVYFHRWGVTGSEGLSVAIIEDEQGRVAMADPTKIQFSEPPPTAHLLAEQVLNARKRLSQLVSDLACNNIDQPALIKELMTILDKLIRVP